MISFAIPNDLRACPGWAILVTVFLVGFDFTHVIGFQAYLFHASSLFSLTVKCWYFCIHFHSFVRIVFCTYFVVVLKIQLLMSIPLLTTFQIPFKNRIFEPCYEENYQFYNVTMTQEKWNNLPICHIVLKLLFYKREVLRCTLNIWKWICRKECKDGEALFITWRR